MQDKKHITIIGAGMAGCLIAIYLAQKEFTVDIYESREDISNLPDISNRSISQYLSARGVRALKKAQLWEKIKKIALEDNGNIFHQGTTLVYKPYGKKQNLQEWSINRNELNKALLTEIQKYPNVQVFFQMKLHTVNFEKKQIMLVNLVTKKQITKDVELLIGADGIHSTVRKFLKNNKLTEEKIEYSDWGYKKIIVPMPTRGNIPFNMHAFHIWSKKEHVIFGTPNRKGLFSCLLNFPLTGKNSFSSLKTESLILHFIKEHFPDLYPYIVPNINEYLQSRPTPFTSLYTSKWHYKDFIVLIGDACHAVPFFYSQGLNSAFEDCRILTECFEKYFPDYEKVFETYQSLRKPNTDMLTDLCKKRLFEFKSNPQNPLFLARNSIESYLENTFPTHFQSLYTLIVHTTIPYSTAFRRFYLQRKIAKLLGIDIVIWVYSLKFYLPKVINLNILNIQLPIRKID